MKIIIHNKLLEFFFAKANDRVCIFFNQKHCLLNKGVSINYKQSHKTVSSIIWDDKNGLKLVNSIFYMERNFWTLPSSHNYCLWYRLSFIIIFLNICVKQWFSNCVPRHFGVPQSFFVNTKYSKTVYWNLADFTIKNCLMLFIIKKS
jgi:hypothetical protein